MVHVQVFCLSGRSLLDCTENSHATVGHLKQLVEDEYSIPNEMQKMLLQTMELDNTVLVRECSVAQNNIILLTLLTTAGGSAWKSCSYSVKRGKLSLVGPHTPGGAALLIEILHDEADPGVRVCALRKLKELAITGDGCALSALFEGDSCSLPAFVTGLDDIDYIRDEALDALVKSAEGGHVDSSTFSRLMNLVFASGRDDNTMRFFKFFFNLVEPMGKSPLAQQFLSAIGMDVISTFVTCVYPSCLRTRAINWLVCVADKNVALQVAMHALDDDEDTVRRAALTNLWILAEKNDAAPMALTIQCLNDTSAIVQLEALEMIEKLTSKGDTDVVAGVVRCLQVCKYDALKYKVVCKAIHTLTCVAMPEDSNSRCILIACQRHQDKSVRRAAYRSLPYFKKVKSCKQDGRAETASVEQCTGMVAHWLQHSHDRWSPQQALFTSSGRDGQINVQGVKEGLPSECGDKAFIADTMSSKASHMLGGGEHSVALGFSSHRDLSTSAQASESDPLQLEQADLQEALLRSKADARNADGVVICRLTSNSPQIRNCLLGSLLLQPCFEEVRVAGCEVSPTWANGALLLVPMTPEQLLEADIDLKAHNVVLLSSDLALLKRALKALPKRKRQRAEVKPEHEADRASPTSPNGFKVVGMEIVRTFLSFPVHRLDLSETSDVACSAPADNFEKEKLRNPRRWSKY